MQVAGVLIKKLQLMTQAEAEAEERMHREQSQVSQRYLRLTLRLGSMGRTAIPATDGGRHVVQCREHGRVRKRRQHRVYGEQREGTHGTNTGGSAASGGLASGSVGIKVLNGGNGGPDEAYGAGGGGGAGGPYGAGKNGGDGGTFLDAFSKQRGRWRKWGRFRWRSGWLWHRRTSKWR